MSVKELNKIDKEKIKGFLRGLYAEAQTLESETAE